MTQPRNRSEEETSLAIREVWEGATFFTDSLDNGLRVSIFADQRMPIVTTQISYAIGSAHEDEDSRGLAHLFEHLMFCATQNNPERAIFDYVEEFGGATNAHTKFDETVYYTLTPPDRFLRVLEMYADSMVNLVVKESDFERDRSIVLEELRATAQNDPISRLQTAALAEGMNNHPYAISPVGTEEDLQKVTLEKCHAFYQKYYGPRNAHLVVAGPVDPPETFSSIEATFGDISKQVQNPGDVPLLSDWSFPEEVLLKDDIPPVKVAAALYALPTADSEDHGAVRFLIEMLSGLDGFDEEIVNKTHRALYAQTLLLEMKAGGVLGFGSVALPYRKKDDAYKYIDETLRRLADFNWLNEQKLVAAKRSYVQGEYEGRYYSSSIATRIAYAQDWLDDVDSAFNREERFETVTVDDVKRVYRKYILDGQPVRAHIEPNFIPWYVRAFGRLYPLAERMGLTGFAI